MVSQEMTLREVALAAGYEEEIERLNIENAALRKKVALLEEEPRPPVAVEPAADGERGWSDAAPSHTLALADHVQAIRAALAADENLMVDVENAGRELRLVRKVTQIEVVV